MRGTAARWGPRQLLSYTASFAGHSSWAALHGLEHGWLQWVLQALLFMGCFWTASSEAPSIECSATIGLANGGGLRLAGQALSGVLVSVPQGSGPAAGMSLIDYQIQLQSWVVPPGAAAPHSQSCWPQFIASLRVVGRSWSLDG